MAGQFPLSGFNVAKWNSVEDPQNSAQKNLDKSAFVHRKSAIVRYIKV